MKALDWQQLADEWDQTGVPFAPVIVVSSTHEADAAGLKLGAPVWVRAPETANDAICVVVANPADLSLAVRQVQKRTGETTVCLQRPVGGSQFRMAGIRAGRDFNAVEIFRDDIPESMYRVTMLRSLPPRLSGSDYMGMLGIARRATRALPPGDGPMAMEFVIGERGPVLTWIAPPPSVDPADALLLRHGLGIDLPLKAKRAADGAPPRLSASRDMGAAIAWLPTHGGVVTGIQGVDRAETMPGVVEVSIQAARGATLGHVTDSVSRDAGGYVVAIGPNAATALSRVAAARDAIEIHVESALG